MGQFFSPEDLINYPPCGMFSLTHIIVALLCFIIVILLCYNFKNIGKDKVIYIIRFISFGVTVLELIKIIYNFYYGYTKLINWFPLSYCSLFIFACYFAGFGKGKIKNLGFSFLTGGCIVAGTTFLIMPTTSLTLHPMFHYLSCYSMLFHSLMIFVGVISFTNGLVEFSKDSFKYYSIFTGFFLLIALILNIICNENLMFIMYPYNIPIDLLHIIANNVLPIYVILACFVYLFVPYVVSNLFCNKLLKK